MASLAKRRLELRFDDAAGRSHGPYALVFDPLAQAVASTRSVLEATTGSWLSFREYPAGHRLVYFTHLVSNRNGLREIRYSVDDASLSKALRFKPARIESVLLPSKTLSAAQRIAIYQEMYPMRMRDALAADYPGIEHFLGHRFWNFVAAYAKVHPSMASRIAMRLIA